MKRGEAKVVQNSKVVVLCQLIRSYTRSSCAVYALVSSASPWGVPNTLDPALFVLFPVYNTPSTGLGDHSYSIVYDISRT